MIYHGDCLEVMQTFEENSIDAVVTDPPYFLGFMNKGWDKEDTSALKCDELPGTRGHGRKPGEDAQIKRRNSKAGQAFHEKWAAEALRICKPGAHMLAFGGTRTHHRLMVAIEDAGWEIRDCLMWVYGSGFPKSLDISKAIDKAAGAEKIIGTIPDRWTGKGNSLNFSTDREQKEGKVTQPTTPAAIQWNGWGTALKPAWEPIILCRKPLGGTVAANVQKWGTGGLNIDACRIGTEIITTLGGGGKSGASLGWSGNDGRKQPTERVLQNTIHKGRFPANLIHDGSDEVLQLFPRDAGAFAPVRGIEKSVPCKGDVVFGFIDRIQGAYYNDSGSAARFFYTAKADSAERNKYLKGLPPKKVNDGRDTPIDNAFQRGETLRKNTHPTVKPVDLLRYLCRLITPPKGVILDPFAGSGSTGIAAFEEGFDSILIEIDEEYFRIAKIRNAQTRLGATS